MKLLKYIFFTAAILMSSLALYAGETVKYVFLFIGDGMSIPQRMTAEEFSRINTGKGLAMNSMPHQALTITRSKNSFITDSAASGTAIACGVKTKNGAIGVGADGSRLQSIAEVARDSGRKVGILTSVTLNHATPASFYGHNPNRGNYYELGLDMIASGFDFFGGGGIGKSVVRRINDAYPRLWAFNLERFARKEPKLNEEAHVMSLLAEHLGIRNADANRYVKRMWTTPKFNNVRPGDEDYAVWHLPYEKKRGLHGLYRLFLRDGGAMRDEAAFWKRAGAYTGIPRIGMGKRLRDRMITLWMKLK